MMLPSFLLSFEDEKKREERRKQAVERRLKRCVPWDPNMPWQEELNLKAETYTLRRLFNVKPSGANVNKTRAGEMALSSKNRFCYVEKKLKRGDELATASGPRQGTVVFDGPILVPALHERDGHGGWRRDPWMSLTPMELLTLRPGTRLAKGTVIIAGLGLGHQLIEISKRKQVKHLTLIEQSAELVDWILPRIQPYLGRPLDHVIVGDAYQELPRLRADVALVDIFPSYGHNDRERDELRRMCFGIKHIWAWGAARL